MIGIVLLLLDLLSFTTLTLIQFHIHIPFQLVLLGAGYLIAKAFMFKDVMSIIDSVIGAYIIIAFIFGGALALYWPILIWFAYKTIVSLSYSVN
jgi:hypothetical protein